jgi:DNA replication protein DnaC
MGVFGKILNELASRDNREDGDYIGDDGFLMCGKCRTPKQGDVAWPEDFGGGTRRVPVLCKCQQDERDREDAEKRRYESLRRVERLRSDGLSDPEYLNWTFEMDDRRDPDISAACKKYVDEWERMKAGNVGLLFFGGVGTGKSFFACCIVNALLERCVPALMTNFPLLLNKIQSAGWGEERNELFGRLQKYELVVIDDLGAERSTDYGMEQIYSVVDTRYRSGKPLIVTTNLSPSEIKNPGNLGYERIYDRIIQNSIPVKMSGTSRRAEIAAQKRRKYENLLGLKT